LVILSATLFPIFEPVSLSYSFSSSAFSSFTFSFKELTSVSYLTIASMPSFLALSSGDSKILFLASRYAFSKSDILSTFLAFSVSYSDFLALSSFSTTFSYFLISFVLTIAF